MKSDQMGTRTAQPSPQELLLSNWTRFRLTDPLGPTGRVAKIFGVENYAPSMGALRSDGAISGPSNRFTDLVEGGEQASRRAVRRRFFQALNVCDTPGCGCARNLHGKIFLFVIERGRFIEVAMGADNHSAMQCDYMQIAHRFLLLMASQGHPKDVGSSCSYELVSLSAVRL